MKDCNGYEIEVGDLVMWLEDPQPKYEVSEVFTDGSNFRFYSPALNMLVSARCDSDSWQILKRRDGSSPAPKKEMPKYKDADGVAICVKDRLSHIEYRGWKCEIIGYSPEWNCPRAKTVHEPDSESALHHKATHLGEEFNLLTDAWRHPKKAEPIQKTTKRSKEGCPIYIGDIMCMHDGERGWKARVKAEAPETDGSYLVAVTVEHQDSYRIGYDFHLHHELWVHTRSKEASDLDMFNKDIRDYFEVSRDSLIADLKKTGNWSDSEAERRIDYNGQCCYQLGYWLCVWNAKALTPGDNTEARHLAVKLGNIKKRPQINIGVL